MKRLIISLIAAISICSFAQSIDLAKMTPDKINPENVEEVFAKAYATTNVNTMVNIGISKAMSLTNLSVRLKGSLPFMHVTRYVINRNGDATQAEKIACFNDCVDTWLSLDANSQRDSLHNIRGFVTLDSKAMVSYSPATISNACAKIYASQSAVKLNGIAAITCDNNSSSSMFPFVKPYIAEIKTSILNEQFGFQAPYFFHACLTIAHFEDKAVIADLIKDVRPYVFFTNKCPFYLTVSSSITRTPHFSNLRKAYLRLPHVTDEWLIKVAKTEDAYSLNRNATASIWAKLSSVSNKLEVANYLNDTDKTIDSLLEIDDKMSATAIAKAVETINSLDPEYRRDDVLKALRVINKRYTLKLYDDRDTWEPILSKVRALIDVYQI